MANEDDFETDDESTDDAAFARLRGKADRGLVVNKSQLSQMTGLAFVTIDRYIAAGAPVEGKGSRKQGWQINTAKFFGWFWRHKVEEATGDPEAGTFDTAKRREKEAQAKLKELEYKRKTGQLIPIDRAVEIYQEDAGQQRSRLLAIPATLAQELAVEDDPAEVEAKITDALNDALGDISGDKGENYTDEASEGGDYADEYATPESDSSGDGSEDSHVELDGVGDDDFG